MGLDVGRYQKGRGSLLCQPRGCEVLAPPALCSAGSFPAAVVRFRDSSRY